MIITKDSHGNYVKIEDIKQQDSFKGISPIDFKSNGDNLKNYRIYGNTVNGESVGDKTGNLFNDADVSDRTVVSELSNYQIYHKNNKLMINGKTESSQSDTEIAVLNGANDEMLRYINSHGGTYSFFSTCPGFVQIRFSIEGEVNKRYSVEKYTSTSSRTAERVVFRLQKDYEYDHAEIGIMVNQGATPAEYEPYGYRVPVTINSNTTSIYLPYQIRKVGDELEYIDYEEQMEHRLRKNLIQNTATSQTINGVTFTVNADGSVTCNGTANSIEILRVASKVSFSDNCILSGSPVGGGPTSFLLRFTNNKQAGEIEQYNDFGNGVTFNTNMVGNIEIRIASGYTCENLAFYPMVRKASVTDDTYESYIQDTELDVTLPTLPTLSGTNALSVNTNIKPSKVWGGLNDPRDILYVKDKLGNILFSKYYEIEDEPPLTYKAKKAGALKDYRIYGNTVNGESVGGRTGNLFSAKLTQGGYTSGSKPNNFRGRVRSSDNDFVFLNAGTYTISWDSDTETAMLMYAYNSESMDDYNSVIISVWTRSPVTFSATSDVFVLVAFKKENNENIIPKEISNIMLSSGLIALPYEPYGYRVPITVNSNTTNIYLDEQLVKSGDDADYIDYATQKRYNADGTTVDVELPTLQTVEGTNTLSVETTVQPSDIYLKGKIEKKPKIYYKIYYYSQDGQTLLYTESVLKGSNGMYSGTPTKMADPQYTYTFAGWSSSTDQTTATPEVRNNIQNDKNVYAAFSQTLNTYTVYFYNESDTPIETVQNVPYGGTATYTGATPTKQGYSFTGWSPLPTNITADTSCYAQFEEDDMYESIADTWSQIIANVSNGTYSTKYHIGDTKKIDLGTEGEVIMTIVGIDTDDLADNSGKAPMTWISKQLLKTSHRMNPSYQSGAEGTGSLGGWEKTEMRSYLKETVKPLIPETVRNAIKPVKKYSRIYNVSGSAVNDVLTTEDVWIPSYKELFGLGLEKQGPTYSTVFPDRASHIKSKVGSRAASWWLRSAGDHYTFFNSVGADGGYGENYARNAGGVALGFCT